VKSQVQSVRSVFHVSAYHHLFIFGHGAVGAKLRCRVIRSGGVSGACRTFAQRHKIRLLLANWRGSFLNTLGKAGRSTLMTQVAVLRCGSLAGRGIQAMAATWLWSPRVDQGTTLTR
jgi:LPS sulfotransferase NodH